MWFLDLGKRSEGEHISDNTVERKARVRSECNSSRVIVWAFAVDGVHVAPISRSRWAGEDMV